MKKIVLCPNPLRDEGLRETQTVRRRLEEAGCRVTICPMFTDPEESSPLPGTVPDLGAAMEGADLLICFGGDGTILHLARAAAKRFLPVLTVNMGNKGFMAELEHEDLDVLVKTALQETYTIEERMMLDVTVERDGQTVYSDCALNDVVVTGMSKILDITVYGDGEKISAFSGDGIIVCTPTGSTAYSMSAGGPIVEPQAENIIITPVCAHALIAKCFVLAPVRTVTVETGNLRSKLADLAVDGGSFRLMEGDVIHTQKSNYVTRLVKATGKSFYEIVNDKLGD